MKRERERDYTEVCNAPVAIIYVNDDGLLAYKVCTARWAHLTVQGERACGVNLVRLKPMRSPLERLTKHLAKHPRGVTDLHAFTSRAMVPAPTNTK